jgi:hypothetical protein
VLEAPRMPLICGERGGLCALRERVRARRSKGQRERVKETADQRM